MRSSVAAIRTLIVCEDKLVLGALVNSLRSEPDLELLAAPEVSDDPSDIVKDLAPDVILIDFELCGSGALGVAEQIHKDGLAGTVCLFSCPPQGPGYLQRALAAGVRAYITKNTDVNGLAAVIRKVHAGGTHVDGDLAASALAHGNNPLTPREREVLRRCSEGLNVEQIAAQLFLAAGTVRNHLLNAVTKLGVQSRASAVITAQQMGWI